MILQRVMENLRAKYHRSYLHRIDTESTGGGRGVKLILAIKFPNSKDRIHNYHTNNETLTVQIQPLKVSLPPRRL